MVARKSIQKIENHCNHLLKLRLRRLKKELRLDIRFDMRLTMEGLFFRDVSDSSMEKATELLLTELLSVDLFSSVMAVIDV